MKISVDSRVHRVLRHMDRYKGSGSCLDDIAKLQRLYENLKNDRLLGLYYNEIGGIDHVLIVGERSLYINDSRGLFELEYARIKSCVCPDKNGSTKLKINLVGGGFYEFNVEGVTAGRFYDVYEFCRFLDRVVEDQKD